MSNKLTAAIAGVGIDIRKNSFHVVGLDERGAIVLRLKWSRGGQVGSRLAIMPPCLRAVSARIISAVGSMPLRHGARLTPAKYVPLYSKGWKNDFRDAEAIAEAAQCPTCWARLQALHIGSDARRVQGAVRGMRASAQVALNLQ